MVGVHQSRVPDCLTNRQDIMPRRGAKVTVKFVTQNLRGLKTETRLEELFAYVQRSGVFAACV